jgi:phage terminase small subunit
VKGRKPKLKLIAGGTAAGKCPPPPGWFQQHARETWQRTAPALFARGLLVPDVMATVESYCIAAGQVVELEALMSVEGRLISDGASGSKPHAAFKMQQAAMR